MQNEQHVTQTELGFVLIDGEQKEIYTPRLRTIPLDDWEEQDWEEELDAIRKAANGALTHAENLEYVKTVMGPIRAQHPGVPIAELIHLLPEPERSYVLALMPERIARLSRQHKAEHKEVHHDRQ